MKDKRFEVSVVVAGQVVAVLTVRASAEWIAVKDAWESIGVRTKEIEIEN